MTAAAKLSDSKIARVRDSIRECDDLIAREMQYQPQFRKESYLRQLTDHRAMLVQMLAAQEVA